MVNEHASDNLEIEGHQSEWNGVTVIGHASNHCSFIGGTLVIVEYCFDYRNKHILRCLIKLMTTSLDIFYEIERNRNRSLRLEILVKFFTIVLIVIRGHAIFHNPFRINLSRAYRIVASVSVPCSHFSDSLPRKRGKRYPIISRHKSIPSITTRPDCILFLSAICQDNSVHFLLISFRSLSTFLGWTI